MELKSIKSFNNYLKGKGIYPLFLASLVIPSVIVVMHLYFKIVNYFF